MKTLFIVAMQDEFEPLSDVLFSASEASINKRGLFYVLRSSKNSLVLSGMGKENAAACITSCLLGETYDRVINVGVAGSLDSAVPIGSIVQCYKVSQWDSFDKSIIEIPVLFPNLESFLCLTGDSLVVDSSGFFTAQSIVDMESYVLASICGKYEVPFYSVKIVSDHCDANSHFDLSKVTSLMADLASFINLNLV